MSQSSRRASYLIPIVIAILTGIGIGLFTRDDITFYQANVIKPPLTPPSWIFPIVWNILYLLMGWGLGRVLVRVRTSSERQQAIWAFIIQLLFNAIWSILFFHIRAYLIAFIWLIILWLLIIYMIRVFAHTDYIAAWMQVPYLLWVTFAGYLNWMVSILN